MSVTDVDTRGRLAERAAKHLVLNFSPLAPEQLEQLPVYVPSRAASCTSSSRGGSSSSG